jgi:hypothetical protein
MLEQPNAARVPQRVEVQELPGVVLVEQEPSLFALGSNLGDGRFFQPLRPRVIQVGANHLRRVIFGRYIERRRFRHLVRHISTKQGGGVSLEEDAALILVFVLCTRLNQHGAVVAV